MAPKTSQFDIQNSILSCPRNLSINIFYNFCDEIILFQCFKIIEAKSEIPFQSNPPSIRRQLKWLRNRYGDMEYFVMENGYPNTGGRNDQDRLQYIKGNLRHVSFYCLTKQAYLQSMWPQLTTAIAAALAPVSSSIVQVVEHNGHQRRCIMD